MEILLRRINKNYYLSSALLWSCLFIVYAAIGVFAGGSSRVFNDLDNVIWPILFSIVLLSVLRFCSLVREIEPDVTALLRASDMSSTQAKKTSLAYSNLIIGKYSTLAGVIAVLLNSVWWLLNVVTSPNLTFKELPYSEGLRLGMKYYSVLTVSFGVLFHWGFVAAIEFSIGWMCVSTLYMVRGLARRQPNDLTYLTRERLRFFVRLASSLNLMLLGVPLILAILFIWALQWGSAMDRLAIGINMLTFIVFAIAIFLAVLHYRQQFIDTIADHEISIFQKDLWSHLARLHSILRDLDEPKEMFRLQAAIAVVDQSIAIIERGREGVYRSRVSAIALGRSLIPLVSLVYEPIIRLLQILIR